MGAYSREGLIRGEGLLHSDRFYMGAYFLNQDLLHKVGVLHGEKIGNLIFTMYSK